MNVSLRTILLAAGAASASVAAGCTHKIAVEPIEVKPIHLTLDVNLKVDRELDEFFDFEEPAATMPVENGATAPANVPTSAPNSAPNSAPAAVEVQDSAPGGQP